MEEKQRPSRDENVVAGRNAVAELLRSGREIDSLYIQKGELKGSAVSLVAKARQLVAHMEVLSQLEQPGRLNSENRQSLISYGANIRDLRELDSVTERDIITNYHVERILALRRELLTLMK